MSTMKSSWQRKARKNSSNLQKQARSQTSYKLPTLSKLQETARLSISSASATLSVRFNATETKEKSQEPLKLYQKGWSLWNLSIKTWGWRSSSRIKSQGIKLKRIKRWLETFSRIAEMGASQYPFTMKVRALSSRVRRIWEAKPETMELQTTWTNLGLSTLRFMFITFPQTRSINLKNACWNPRAYSSKTMNFKSVVWPIGERNTWRYRFL